MFRITVLSAGFSPRILFSGTAPTLHAARSLMRFHCSSLSWPQCRLVAGIWSPSGQRVARLQRRARRSDQF